jgi:hypothetical protein
MEVVCGRHENRGPAAIDQNLAAVDIVVIGSALSAVMVTEVLDCDFVRRIREIDHRDRPARILNAIVQLRFREPGIEERQPQPRLLR